MSSNTHNMLSTSSSDALRSDVFSLADELSRVADTIKWPRAPEMGEVEKMAELATAADCYSLGDLLDISVAERTHLQNLLLTMKGSLARAMREILD